MVSLLSHSVSQPMILSLVSSIAVLISIDNLVHDANMIFFWQVMPMEMHMLHAADLKHHGQANMADIFAEMATWGVHSDRTGVRYSTQHLLANISDVVDKRGCR